jgi:hypothetical protein
MSVHASSQPYLKFQHVGYAHQSLMFEVPELPWLIRAIEQRGNHPIFSNRLSKSE